jgi:hypothetical protein
VQTGVDLSLTSGAIDSALGLSRLERGVKILTRAWWNAEVGGGKAAPTKPTETDPTCVESTPLLGMTLDSLTGVEAQAEALRSVPTSCPSSKARVFRSWSLIAPNPTKAVSPSPATGARVYRLLDDGAGQVHVTLGAAEPTPSREVVIVNLASTLDPRRAVVAERRLASTLAHGRKVKSQERLLCILLGSQHRWFRIVLLALAVAGCAVFAAYLYVEPFRQWLKAALAWAR